MAQRKSLIGSLVNNKQLKVNYLVIEACDERALETEIHWTEPVFGYLQWSARSYQKFPFKKAHVLSKSNEQ